MINGKNILVTGGAGFIGSNLCEKLVELGNNVVCLDNFSTGKRENIEALLQRKNFKLIEGDIRLLETCREAVKGIDYVLHEAALGSVPRSIKDPITTNEVNVSGFLNMLVASRDEGVKRFVYAASSSSYGDSALLPKVEDIIGRPLSPYAISKYADELYAEVFAKLYDMQLVGLRYFNVFGRKQDPYGPYAAAIPLFISRLIAHESPVVNGDGTNSRDFTYIDNVIQMNLLALTTKNPDAINQVYNTASAEQTDLNTLIAYLKELLIPFDSEIANIKNQYGQVREGDIPHSLANIDKARKLLGYSPIYSVREGLGEAIPWYWEYFKKG